MADRLNVTTIAFCFGHMFLLRIQRILFALITALSSQMGPNTGGIAQCVSCWRSQCNEKSKAQEVPFLKCDSQGATNFFNGLVILNKPRFSFILY